LYYQPAAGGAISVVDVGNVTTNSVSGLVPATTYSFFVTAYNAANVESAPSTAISFAVPGTDEIIFRATTPNGRPSSIALDRAGLAKLSWSAVPGKSYQVLYKTNLTDPTWTRLGSDVRASDATAFQSDHVVGNRFYTVIQLP
jgi:hypothetical protein